MKGVEVGLHLSLVDGYSLSKRLSLLDAQKYFPEEKPCLHLNWKRFAADFLKGKIQLEDLRLEFELQIEEFKKKVGPIPFLNGTYTCTFSKELWN